jgi:hypothetical protein
MRWIVIAVVMVGCIPPKEADYPDVWAGVDCARQQECDKGAFESDWSDMDDCRSQMADFADSVMDAQDLFGGEYDSKHAGECLSAVRTATCEEFQNNDFNGNCDHLYD